MNRRDFIKLLGKVTGLAAVVGLLSDDILYLGEMSDERYAKGEWNGMTLDHQSGVITLDEYAKIIGVDPEHLIAMHGKFDGISS